MRENLSWVSGIILMAGFLVYIRTIVTGKTIPSPVTWLLWALLDSIALAGMWWKDALNGQIVSAVIGVTVIAVLSLKYGRKQWTTVDSVCLSGACLGLGLWYYFQDPVLGVVTSVIVIFLASIPTYYATWFEPEKEDKLAWTLYFIACMVMLPAIPAWTLIDAAQPICFALIETVMVLILWVPRKVSLAEDFS